jgi:hypothetical protein
MSNSKQTHKERGGCLTAWLVLIILQSIVYTGLILYLRQQQHASSPAWVWISLFLLSIVDIVAMIGVWNWKKWGLQLYSVSTAIGIAVGLMLTGSQLIVFHDIVPLAILGYLIKDKWSYLK